MESLLNTKNRIASSIIKLLELWIKTCVMLSHVQMLCTRLSLSPNFLQREHEQKAKQWDTDCDQHKVVVVWLTIALISTFFYRYNTAWRRKNQSSPALVLPQYLDSYPVLPQYSILVAHTYASRQDKVVLHVMKPSWKTKNELWQNFNGQKQKTCSKLKIGLRTLFLFLPSIILFLNSKINHHYSSQNWSTCIILTFMMNIHRKRLFYCQMWLGDVT